jgi:hypothetical protein
MAKPVILAVDGDHVSLESEPGEIRFVVRLPVEKRTIDEG